LEDVSALVLKAKVGDLDKFVFVCVQHLLETTGSLFEALLELGVPPKHIYVLGKTYSTIPKVESGLRSSGIQVRNIPPGTNEGYRQQMETACEKLWKEVERRLPERIKGIIVLDEGGFCLKAIPQALLSRLNVVGVEQTRSGLRYKESFRFPVILVASCAAKRYFEPPIISREIESVLTAKVIGKSDKTYGVLGLGSIGQSVTSMLLKCGKRVCVYDRNHNKMELLQMGTSSVTSCSSCEDFIRKSDVVFGCTGQDALSKLNFDAIGRTAEKQMISCSSGDIEFLTLLKRSRQNVPNNNQFANATVTVGGNVFVVHNGGCPINFNRAREVSSPAEIQFTRALLFGGIIQAIMGANHKPALHGSEQLSPIFQKYVIEKWLESDPKRKNDYSPAVLWGANNRHWITTHSGGKDFGIMEEAGLQFQSMTGTDFQ